MEISRRYITGQHAPLAAYLALQRALIERHVAGGGSAEEFCARLAPVYHRRFGPLFFGADPPAAGTG
ncbi:MAG TPA: hypothetical protein VHG51_03800 [Longimicrobiaceae bacterium]|nr:hypothetical protein [Longimicrobiaceae bacterium]